MSDMVRQTSAASDTGLFFVDPTSIPQGTASNRQRVVRFGGEHNPVQWCPLETAGLDNAVRRRNAEVFFSPRTFAVLSTSILI